MKFRVELTQRDILLAIAKHVRDELGIACEADQVAFHFKGAGRGYEAVVTNMGDNNGLDALSELTQQEEDRERE